MVNKYEEFKKKQIKRIQLLLDVYNEENVELFGLNIPGSMNEYMRVCLWLIIYYIFDHVI